MFHLLLFTNSQQHVAGTTTVLLIWPNKTRDLSAFQCVHHPPAVQAHSLVSNFKCDQTEREWTGVFQREFLHNYYSIVPRVGPHERDLREGVFFFLLFFFVQEKRLRRGRCF